MAKLPRPAGSDMVRFRVRNGFQLVRVRGSHHFMQKGKQRTSVPVHGSRILKIGTLRSILRDVGMSATDFVRLWGEQ
jgi:predicted RNA binding protein YcfA (HicA-like mRNA interferase family)